MKKLLLPLLLLFAFCFAGTALATQTNATKKEDAKQVEQKEQAKVHKQVEEPDTK